MEFDNDRNVKATFRQTMDTGSQVVIQDAPHGAPGGLGLRHHLLATGLHAPVSVPCIPPHSDLWEDR